MDETGIPLELHPPRLLQRRGKESKISDVETEAANKHCVIGCGSVTGHVIPPFIVFAAK